MSLALTAWNARYLCDIPAFRARITLALIVVLTFATLSVSAQQDPLYNLYGFNQVMINPAYAGVYENIALNLISRKQWVGIDGSPLTNFLSVTSSIDNRFGVGGMIISDRLGINTTTEFQGAFSYKIFEDAGRSLSFGVQGGLIHYRYDYSRLNLQYLDDEDLDMDRTNYSRPNFGAGVYYRSDRIYLGLSSPRLLNVEVNDGVASSTRYLRHFYLSGGGIVNGNFKGGLIRFRPSFLLRYVPDGNMALDLSMHALLLETLWVGATYRNLSGIGIDGQLQVSQRVRLGYAFELATTSLLSRNFGTHELSLLIEFSPLGSQQKVFRYF